MVKRHIFANKLFVLYNFCKVMRFYDREKEIAEVRRIDALAEHSAQLNVLMGRRWSGKVCITVDGRGMLDLGGYA